MVKIWDSVTGKELCSLSDGGAVFCVTFSPDGQRLASGGFSPLVKIWNGATGEELSSIKRHARSGVVQSMAFSADGQRLASACSTLTKSTLTIWDCASGKELLSLKGHAGPVMSVAFSPDGQRLASGGAGDMTVKIWDSASGKELFSLKGHAGAVRSVAFSPDGQRLASAGVDNTLKIWNCATGKDLLSLKGHAGRVTSVAFSPDGQSLASAEGDYVVLRETTVSTEMQQRRDAHALVADLFEQVGLRTDVLERVRTAHGLSPAVRREALAAAQAHTENAFTLSTFAWERVRLPGADMAGYRNALRCSEEACRLEPQNGDYLNTLGVAYYRVGNYGQALAMLLRSVEINKRESEGSVPAALAFLAMTRRQLGHAEEAQAELQRLREWMKDRGLTGNGAIARSLQRLRERKQGRGWAKDAEAQGFLREAEELLAKPETPDGK